jgi:hypothetical protein
MALPGRKPKPENQRRNRSDPRIVSLVFADVPNPNPRRLPPVAELRDATGLTAWPAFTKRWWRGISRLPHTIAWTDADWDYAQECAFLHAQFATGAMSATAAGELRRRSHQLGATWQGRLDLRIVYRDDNGEDVRDDKGRDPAVTAMADYRKAVE